MRSKINYSRYSIALTAILFGILFIVCIACIHEKPAFFIILSIFIILIVCGLLYGSAYIQASPDYIILGSILKRRKILMRNVGSVELFHPTMGAVRIFGSGGFMGYWGIFKEGDIGRYFAFYGKSSECFLVRMKNGDKYILGCENPNAMVNYIDSQIK